MVINSEPVINKINITITNYPSDNTIATNDYDNDTIVVKVNV